MIRHWAVSLRRVSLAFFVCSILSGTAVSGVSPVQGVLYASHVPIAINGNSGFNTGNGVRSGDGSPSNPYIISGWRISVLLSDAVSVRGTTAFFVLQNVEIDSGNLTHNGIVLTNVAHARISNSTISGNISGILVVRSTDVIISGNSLLSNQFGISVESTSLLVKISGNSVASSQNFAIHTSSSSNITISDNAVSLNGKGVILESSSNITFTRNTFHRNGLILANSTLPELETYTISPDNSVDGKPIYFYDGCTSLNVTDENVGQLIAVGCTGIQISNVAVSGTDIGVQLLYVNGGLISKGHFASNRLQGVSVVSSNHVTVSNDTISSNGEVGISVDSSSPLTITNNNILWNNGTGVSISTSNIAIVTQNIVSENGLGVKISSSTAVHFYHNNLLNNKVQVISDQGTGSSWDNGYPDGGNYWSNYSGKDECSGQYQNICPDPDGIVDFPFFLGSSTIDYYPLVSPFATIQERSSPTWPSWATILASELTASGVTLSWSTANDDVGVINYRVYQSYRPIATVPGNTFHYSVSGLAENTNYTFRVEAMNRASNWSYDGPSVAVTTPTSHPESVFKLAISPNLILIVVLAALALALTVMALGDLRRKMRSQVPYQRDNGRTAFARQNSIQQDISGYNRNEYS